MIDQSVIDKAVELARATTGEKRATPVTTEEVRRLDRPGESFLLVHFGSPGTGGSIAAVRLGETIEVMTWAANPSGKALSHRRPPIQNSCGSRAGRASHRCSQSDA